MDLRLVASVGLLLWAVSAPVGPRSAPVGEQEAQVRAQPGEAAATDSGGTLDEVLETLRAALSGGDPQQAALVLGYAGAMEAPWLVAELRRLAKGSGEQGPGLRIAALFALAEVDPKEGVALYAEILGDRHENPLVRQAVAEKLSGFKGGYGASLVRPLLADPDPTLRVLAAGLLLELGDAAGLELLHATLLGDDADLRVDAASELLDAGRDEEAALAALAQVLTRQAEPIARSNAAYALGETRHPQARRLLVRTLADMDRGVRVAAANSLALVGEEEALMEMALRDPDYLVRLEAIHGLAALAPTSTGVHRVLRRALDDPIPSVRLAAAAALGEGGGNGNLVATVRRELASDDYTVRLGAISTLGRMGDLATVGHLQPLLRHPDPVTRLSAAVAIHRILTRR